MVRKAVYWKADYMQDLQISNDLLAFSEYGGKTNWSISDLNYLENKVSQFSDQTLKQVHHLFINWRWDLCMLFQNCFSKL